MEQERNDLHSSNVGDSLGMNKVFVFNCPYLGTLEDSATSLAYPAVANHCFRVESPTAVDLSHQEDYCLTDRHSGCHVFQMASAATAEVEPVAPLTVPKKQKRRVSYFALPLILILILLAAIIWWPAPGTSIQESLVLGAQNDQEVGGGATLNGKPVPQPPQVEKGIEVTSPDTVPDPAPSVSLNESGDRVGKGETNTAPVGTAGNSTAGNVQPEDSSTTIIAIAPEQLAEATSPTESNTETAAAPAQSAEVEAPVEIQTPSEEISEASADSTVSSEENFSSSIADVVSNEESDETSQATVSEEYAVESEEDAAENEEDAAENEEDAAESDEDTVELPTVVTADLPVISSDVPAVTTAPEQSATTNDPGELVTLVGPALNTSLSLRDNSEDVDVLPVYQGPASDSELLSHIDHRQFVTLLERDSGGNWLKVRLGTGVEGWIDAVQSEAAVVVSSLPLEGEAPSTQPAAERPTPARTSYPVIRSASVDTGALNVRSGPGFQYDPITIINNGEIVGLIGRRALGPWVRIRLDTGLEGWVNSSLLAQAS